MVHGLQWRHIGDYLEVFRQSVAVSMLLMVGACGLGGSSEDDAEAACDHFVEAMEYYFIGTTAEDSWKFHDAMVAAKESAVAAAGRDDRWYPLLGALMSLMSQEELLPSEPFGAVLEECSKPGSTDRHGRDEVMVVGSG